MPNSGARYPGSSVLFNAADIGVPGAGEGALNGYLCLAKLSGYPPASTSPKIRLFRATIEVPKPPMVEDSQTVFLFLGMQPAIATGVHSILQPVLYWGLGMGGSSRWSVASWYVRASAPQVLDVSARTEPVTVESGLILTASIGMEETSNRNYRYRCGFEGIRESALVFESAMEMAQCGIALEVNNLAGSQGLPGNTLTAFRNISIRDANDADIELDWKLENRATHINARAAIVSDNGIQNEIDIYYR